MSYRKENDWELPSYIFGMKYENWITLTTIIQFSFLVTLCVVFTTLTATGNFNAKFNTCASSITSNETFSKGNIEADWDPNQKCHAWNYGYVIGSAAAMALTGYMFLVIVFVIQSFMGIDIFGRDTNGPVLRLSEMSWSELFTAPNGLLDVNISPMMAWIYTVYMPIAMVLVTVFVTISTTETIILIGALALATEFFGITIMVDARAHSSGMKNKPGVSRSGASYVSLFFFGLLTAFQIAFLIYWISVYPSKTIKAAQIVVVIFMCLHLGSRAIVRICYYVRVNWALQVVSDDGESLVDVTSEALEEKLPIYVRYEIVEQLIFYVHAIIVLSVGCAYANGHDWVPERNFY